MASTRALYALTLLASMAFACFIVWVRERP